MQITLNRADVLPKMQAAFLEFRLSAQRSNSGVCRYRDYDGNPCVVGAALTDDEAAYLDSLGGDTAYSLGVDRLFTGGTIETDAVRFLKACQNAHDLWVGGNSAAAEDLRGLLELPEDTPLYPDADV